MQHPSGAVVQSDSKSWTQVQVPQLPLPSQHWFVPQAVPLADGPQVPFVVQVWHVPQSAEVVHLTAQPVVGSGGWPVAVQIHCPPWHTVPVMTHGLPQPPQLLMFESVSIQTVPLSQHIGETPLQHTCVPFSLQYTLLVHATHDPPWQIPDEHLLPHLLQLLTSEVRSTQLPLQQVNPVPAQPVSTQTLVPPPLV